MTLAGQNNVIDCNMIYCAMANRPCRKATTPALHSGGPRFISRTEDWLFLDFSDFPPSLQANAYSKLGHHLFFSYSFQFIIHWSSSHSMLHNLSLLACLLTYGAEQFLRSSQLCSHSRTSQHFMEPEGSLPWSLSWARSIQSIPSHPISLT
jgi:hypothetical protein